MVKSILSLGRSGLQDWLLQRISAVILGSYFVFILAYIGLSQHVTFDAWQILFECVWMRVFTFFALLSLVVHSWIGLWIVLTDYIKIFWLRLVMQISINLILLAYLAVGLAILFGYTRY